jgi:hypothetical protein
MEARYKVMVAVPIAAVVAIVALLASSGAFSGPNQHATTSLRTIGHSGKCVQHIVGDYAKENGHPIHNYMFYRAVQICQYIKKDTQLLASTNTCVVRRAAVIAHLTPPERVVAIKRYGSFKNTHIRGKPMHTYSPYYIHKVCEKQDAAHEEDKIAARRLKAEAALIPSH